LWLMKGIQSEKVSNGGYKYTQLLRSRIGEINWNMLIQESREGKKRG
jgi:hypothetical protein